MAERDQLVRLLRRHDAGDARGAEHVALLGVAREHEVERLRSPSRTRPSATATRSVAALAETSTMRASPPWPRWVSLRAATASLRRAELASRSLAASSARVAASTSACRIRLSPTRKVEMPTAREPREIGGREDAALADGDAVARNPAARAARLVASVVSKVFRSRLLMPISRERQPQRALELGARRGPRAARPCRSAMRRLLEVRAPRRRRPPP